LILPAHFVIEIDEKFSITDGFQYDLMMTHDSKLLLGGREAPRIF